jgi:CHRD domain
VNELTDGTSIRLLTGQQENPSVNSTAFGSSDIQIGVDRVVSGSITTTGIVGTAAHIHDGRPGTNGPAIITLTQVSPNIWTVPTGTRATEEQFARYTAGELYLNVHRALHESGEIRAQLTP